MSLLNASIRHAARQFSVSRGFTAAAVLTLALGIGGTTAIFTLMDAVMFRSLPVSDPARLYRIGDGDDTIAQGRHGRWGFFSFPLYERLKAGTPEFEDITAFGLGNQLSVRRQGTADADYETTAPVAVVNEAFVKRFFRGDEGRRVHVFFAAIIPAARAAAISPTSALRTE
jgi:hypothetical protein